MVSDYSIVGLGKLGASMLAAIASRGLKVIGVDVNPKAVELVKEGRAPVQETDLQETITANRERIRATTSFDEAILSSDLTFVIVPTPSMPTGAFSLDYAAAAFREIGRSLARKDGYHNVVLTSTVLPGATRYGLLPILERESGKKCGRDFGLCYSPEFIALGSVIRDFLNPDFTLLGEFDDRCGTHLEAAYRKIMARNPPCMRMSLENAELTKISVNAFITTKITFANMLAEICEEVPGGDIDIVAGALGHDRRIGHDYLKGGLGYGGPCFPRDNKALSYIANALGCRAEIAETTDVKNRFMPERILGKLLNLIPKGATVGLLGLAYKPFSHVVEESQSVYLARSLSAAGFPVIGYDPLAGEEAMKGLSGHAVIVDNIRDCLQKAQVILICTPDPAFKVLKDHDFRGEEKTVVDFWRFLEEELADKYPQVRYVPFGRGANDEYRRKRLEELWNGWV